MPICQQSPLSVQFPVSVKARRTMHQVNRTNKTMQYIILILWTNCNQFYNKYVITEAASQPSSPKWTLLTAWCTLFHKRSITAWYNRNPIYQRTAFCSCTCSLSLDHLSCKALDFSGALSHMGTLWCPLFHRQMIVGEGGRQRKEERGGQCCRWLPPALKAVEKDGDLCRTERCLAKIHGGKILPHIRFYRNDSIDGAASHSMHSTPDEW